MNELRAQLSEQGIDVDFSDVVDEAEAAAVDEAEAAAEEPAGDKVFEFSIYRDRKDEGAEARRRGRDNRGKERGVIPENAKRPAPHWGGPCFVLSDYA